MKYLLKRINYISAFIFVIFIVLILIKPNVCTDGAAKGLMLCARIIIPSLFPFTVCVLFLQNSGIFNKIKFLNKITMFLFSQNSYMFSIMFLSFIGGYPIGAKLLNQAVENKTISRNNASIMLNYCINAGPAFIIPAVGAGILGSKVIGYVLLISHILSSIILAIIFSCKIEKKDCLSVKTKQIGITDNFVVSTSTASSAMLCICSYVIFFSTIISYINYYSVKYTFLKYISYFLEVTNAVTLTKNILIISFLLGFSGICIWCQVMSVSNNIKKNYYYFFLSRIMHGLFSCGITYLLIKIFKISVNTISNIEKVGFDLSYTTFSLSISLICLAIIFIISINNKRSTGNIIDELV